MGGKQIQAPNRSGILRSKLVKPQISGKLVPRKVFTTLADKLVNGMKVGLVIAPAGYGKSTLLSESFDVLTEQGVHCAWLSLDDNDNDPLRFLSQLLATLNTLSSLDFQLETDQLGADSKTIIDHIVADTVIKLDALDFRHALFLDDYHAINNPEVHGLLERLVLYSPPRTMFVIASRNEPELAFSALRMREEVCQLSARDLAFALEESEQFLNVDKQLGLSSQLIKALTSRTEGWVAGLQLASLALAGVADSAKFVEEFSGTDRDVTDYLGEAVLNQQTDEIRHFLLRTSLLERMNADLVNAVLGTETGQAMLELVEAGNLFVIPLDRKRSWYRYHHLFGDFLKMQLVKEYPGAVETVYQRAFAWCVEQGHHHEAINYALCAGLKEQAIELIADIAKDLVQVSGEHWTLLHWLQQLPEAYVLKRPEIGAAVSWSLLFSRQFSKARDLLDMLDRHCEQAAKGLAPELLGQLRCDIGLNRCFLEAVEDNTEHASELLKAWLVDNPTAESRDQVTAYILQAYTSVSTFEIDQGTVAAARAASIGGEFAVGFLGAWAQAAVGLLGMQRVDLEGAVRHFRQGLEYNARNASPFSWVGSLNSVLLAEALYEQNNLAEAEALLQDHFEYIENQSAVDIAYAGYRVMAKLQFLRSNLAAGLKVIRLGKESAIRAKLPRLGAMLSALEVSSLLRAGKSNEARHIANEIEVSELQSPPFVRGSPPVMEELRALVQAELYLDKGSPKRATAILDTLVTRAEETGRQRRLLEMLLLRARALQASHRPDDALIDLGRAIEIGAQGELCRVFIDAGEEVQQLLRVYAKESSDRQVDASIAFLDKINKLLRSDRKNSQADATKGEPTSVLIEALTKRERQVLETIITGETNKEVAEKLFISEQTVKWHLHQIYQKLGVKNRTRAIARAQALSLL
tara:strand:+ start:3692 stop:6451 length:2760 start_codon:yes stop_codon:yes gene_type:complete